MLHITVTNPEAQTKTYDLDGPLVRIGRDPDNHIVLPDRQCSRHHAEVLIENGSYRIKDLGSANGTFHGPEAVQELALSDGTSVTIGASTLTFNIEQPREATARVLVYET